MDTLAEIEAIEEELKRLKQIVTMKINQAVETKELPDGTKTYNATISTGSLEQLMSIQARRLRLLKQVELMKL